MYTVSWNTYLIGMSIAVLIYYVAVYLLFFRGTMRLPKGNATGGSFRERSKNTGTPGREPSRIDPKSQEHLQGHVYDLVHELQAYIMQAGQEGVGKEELVQSLYKITAKYPEIEGSLFQEGIRNLTAATVEDHCAYRLSADELAVLWRGEQA